MIVGSIDIQDGSTVQLVGGEEKALDLDVAATAETALAGLARMVVKFADPNTPYLSRPRPQFESRFGDYDHLARVREWALLESEEDVAF